MKRSIAAAGLLVMALAAPAGAAVSFEYLFDGGFPINVTPDGNVIVGNTADTYGAFRWTRSGGFVRLGMDAAPVIGGTGGVPGVSNDGTKVAATIIGPDSTYSTMGLWTLGSGWQTLEPPIPPGGGVVDRALADVQGLSGDGKVVVGLQWRVPGRAHAVKWTQATGAVDLGSAGNASKAMHANFDGSVIAGWDESVLYGYRTPSVWVNDVRFDLEPNQIGEAWYVTGDGSVLGGFLRDSVANQRSATLWKKSGGNWTHQFLGVVPGTSPGYGINGVEAVSADGKLAVGYCSFAGDPFSTTGFIWTDSTGVMDIVDWLGNQGILPDPSFGIQSLQTLTPDGRTLIGFGRMTVSPYTTRAFAIHLDRAAAGVNDPAPRATDIALSAAPNPVRGSTRLSFTLPQSATGSIRILDVSGRLVRQVLAGELAAGAHQVTWDGRDAAGAPVPTGVYLVRFDAGPVHASQKLAVVR